MGVGDDIAPRFTQKPVIRQESGGQRLVFQCAVEASPKPDVSWFRGTMPLSNSARVRMRVDNAGGIAYNVFMEIMGVSQGDAGTYKVTAKNKLGEVSANINLNFSGVAGLLHAVKQEDVQCSATLQHRQEGIAPNFTQKPVTRQENSGQRLLFECMLTSEPAPTITWFRDNFTINSGGRYKIRVEPRDNKTYFVVLEINGVNAQDAGNYKVLAKNAHGESNATIRLNFDTTEVQIQGVRPVFLEKPTIRQEGDKIILECKLSGDPRPAVTWSLNNEPMVFEAGSRLTPRVVSEGHSHTVSLEIGQAGMADAGEYRAHARSDLGEATATITLNFEGAKKPQVPQGKAPHFTQKPAIRQQPGAIIMSCPLEASPAPRICWFREATEISAGARHSVSLQRDPSGPDRHTAILQIKDPQQGDGGNYKCVAANDLGESNTNITLNFSGGQAPKPAGAAPTFTQNPVVTQEAGGKNLRITCQCTASPKPTITWMKGPIALKPSARILPTVAEEGNKYTLKLDILNVNKADGGNYKVVAKNDMGEGSANISINLEPPKEAAPQAQGTPVITLEDNGRMIMVRQAISCPSKPTALWYFGNQPVSPVGRLKTDITKEGDLYYMTLKIPNFTDRDSGTYKLITKGSGGEVTVNASVNVAALRPKPKGEAPKILQRLAPQNVNDKDAVDFVAKVTGTEPVEVQWAKDGKPLTSSNTHKISYDKGTCRLYIPEVFPPDSGNYSITVKNQWGNASSTAGLQVKEPKTDLKQDAKKTGKADKDPKTADAQKTPQKPLEPGKKEPAKPVEDAMKKGLAKPKEESAPPKKDEPKKNEPAAQKKEEPKPAPPPTIVVEEEDKKGKGNPPGKNPGKSPGNPGQSPQSAKKAPGNPESPGRKGNPKERSSSPEDSGVVNGDNKKSKDKKAPKGKQKPYTKAPTTILEEEGDEDGYDADVDGSSAQGGQLDDDELSDDGKASMDKIPSVVVLSDGPFFKVKPSNQVIMEGDTMRMDVEVALDGKPMPSVHFIRAGRELKEDSRVSFYTDKQMGIRTLEIRKTRLTDEAKYTVNLEQDGVITDTATFSVFIKDPKDSNLDFRALLKHREMSQKKEDEDDIDFGSLRPVDKKGRRLSQIEVMKMNLKKVDKAEGSDSEEEKLWGRKRDPGDFKGRKLSRSQQEAPAEWAAQLAEKACPVSLAPHASCCRPYFSKEPSRRQSLEPDIPVIKVSADKLEAMEQQRRASMQTRRTSLADVISDWPLLQKRIIQKETHRTSLADVISDWPLLQKRIIQKEEPDKFVKDLEDIKVIEGKTVEFMSEFCKPNAKLRWFKNKLEVFHGHKYHFINDDAEYSLRINNVKPEDGGKFTVECNGISSSAWLYVEAKEPEYYFTQKLPEKYEVKRKKTGMLECFVSDSRAFIKWYRNGEAMEVSEEERQRGKTE
ncbi:hypothetical protein ACOMHN_010757 [Nucella lapillus]